MEDMIKFLEYIRKLKRTPRAGWQMLGIKNLESVADHSFGTALMGMVYSDIKKLDTERVLRMSLLHDFAESITGDIPHPDKVKMGLEVAQEKENFALKKILSLLPEELKSEYLDIWEDFENKK